MTNQKQRRSIINTRINGNKHLEEVPMKILVALALTTLISASAFACSGNKDNKEDKKETKATTMVIKPPVYSERL